MKTLLICHESETLDRVVMPRWLGSFSKLVGIVVIRERSTPTLRRATREIRRVGPLRFIDVVALRLYYRLFLARRDRRWQTARQDQLLARYPPVTAPVLVTESPNALAVQQFIAAAAPDLVVARCKVLLEERIFSIPARGTFVMHPGICPEYRNAHGCFWAISRGDFDRVGMTLLRVDSGIDTGAVFGYFTYPFDSYVESHVAIQSRVVYDNLDAIARTLSAIGSQTASPIDTTGRNSAIWGHPWLTRYLRWKLRAWRTGR